MPRWTQQELDSYERLNGHRHPESRPRTGLQKQEDNRRETPDNSTQSEKVDGGCDQQYHLSVEVLMSDKRRRDLDGALATLCDCLTAARRQLEGDTEDNGKSKGGS